MSGNVIYLCRSSQSVTRLTNTNVEAEFTNTNLAHWVLSLIFRLLTGLLMLSRFRLFVLKLGILGSIQHFKFDIHVFFTLSGTETRLNMSKPSRLRH